MNKRKCPICGKLAQLEGNVLKEHYRGYTGYAPPWCGPHTVEPPCRLRAGLVYYPEQCPCTECAYSVREKALKFAKPDPDPVLVGVSVITRNKRGCYLLQLRADGFWGGPGGKAHAGESLAQAASREHIEETGHPPKNLQLAGVHEDLAGWVGFLYRAEWPEEALPVQAQTGGPWYWKSAVDIENLRNQGACFLPAVEAWFSGGRRLF